MVDPELLELFSQTVKLAPGDGAGFDAYGQTDNFGADIELQAHVEGTVVQSVADPSGHTYYTQGIVYLTDVYPWIDVRCRLTLDNAQRVVIVNVATDWDENGPYCTRVTFRGEDGRYK